eukprot:15339816-Ditylum_brightwellii.AAC.1
MAAKLKVAVLTLQSKPPGMCPCVVFLWCPQTIIKASDWGTNVLDVCNEAAMQDGNAVALNSPTDGVSCK